MRVAVIFFGIARSTQITLESIQRNAIDCNIQRGVSFFTVASLNLIERVDNPRAGEIDVSMSEADALSLKADAYMLVRQDDASIAKPLKAAQQRGDIYDNGWASVRNLLHQLESLSRGWNLCEQLHPGRFDYYLFLRPDLLYLDEIHLPQIASSFRAAGSIAVPTWHSWSGFNDRFAFADPKAARHYAQRIRHVPAYCAINRMHPETLLAYALRKGRCSVRALPARARRVRAHGSIREEDFDQSKANLPVSPTLFSFVGQVRFHSRVQLLLQIPYLLDLYRSLKIIRFRLLRRFASSVE